MATLFARTMSDNPWDRTSVLVDGQNYKTNLRGELDLTQHPYKAIREVWLDGKKVHGILSAESPKGLNVADIQKIVVRNVGRHGERITAEVTKK